LKKPAVTVLLLATACVANSAAGLLEVDYRSLVSRADLTYDRPVNRSEEGLPVGNGRMGSLLWTTPTALKFQINRVDVFASGCATNSFPERHTDYCGGCGFVDVDFVDYGDDVFPSEGIVQHLSCYDGLVTVKGKGVMVQALAWNEKDVMAIEITDQRERPGTISVNLRMLRTAVVRTASHTATSKLQTRDGRIILTQEFVEDNYFCGSAVAVGVVSRNAEVRRSNDMDLRLVVEPGQGSFAVLIAGAASFDRKEGIVALALAQLESAASTGYAGLVESNRKWWHEFWEKSFVHLHSEDGVADRIEESYTYYLYIMASSSRGKYPAKFNGMLWTTGGDTRKWGSQYWGANQSCLYNNALFAANRIELTDPMFKMYSGMYDSCALAAQQQWGSKGIYIPETVAFDGLAELPADIASEMRDLYLLRKSWDTRSEIFRNYAGTKQPHSSRWNWIQSGKWVDGRWVYAERGSGPYGPVTHIFSRGAKIAYQYWLRYEYTLDEKWLRDRAYPILKAVAEFYRNYPNVKKGPDGKYHIHNVNSNEPLWGGQDTDEEISSMMGILPVVIKASQILNVDTEMRPVWQEFLDNLASLPRSDNPNASSSRTRSGPPVWIKGLNPVVRGEGASLPDGNTMPMWFFDLCTLETDPETLKTANATFDAYFPNGVGPGRKVGVLSKLSVTASVLGRADAVKYLIPNQIQTKETPILANRMDLREGTQTTSVQRLGGAADALHTALCQSVPAGPGKPSVIRVFPAWPSQWDAAFTLLVRGAFLVSASMEKGRIEFVEIQSQVGGECRLRNPWPEGEVTLYRNNKISGSMNGSLLRFDTIKNENIVVVPKGSTPSRKKVL
jgi:hypothetical protein